MRHDDKEADVIGVNAHKDTKSGETHATSAKVDSSVISSVQPGLGDVCCSGPQATPFGVGASGDFYDVACQIEAKWEVLSERYVYQ